MKISICIPVKGRKSMLQQALYSILLQDYSPIELIIQDGDPDDPVQDIPALNQFADLKYECGKDGGIFPALNKCLKRSTGELLYFMCSDDMLYPGALQLVVKTFQKDRFGGAYWTYGQTVSSDEWGQPLGLDGEPTTYDALILQNRIGSPSVFWNREMFNLVGLFDTRYRLAADYDMWIRMWRHREPWFIDKPLGIFRHHPESETQKYQEATNAEARRVAFRQTRFGSMIDSARRKLFTRQVYDGDDVPVAHDDTPN